MSCRPIPHLAFTSLALALCLAAVPLHAQQAPPPAQKGGAPQETQAMRDLDAMGRQERTRMLSDAVRRAQASSGGTVLGAESVQFDGKDITRVKVMDERGRVRYQDYDNNMQARGRMDLQRPRPANPSRP